MRVLKGFVTIQSLLSNVPGVVSPLGELSTMSLTYTREKGEYLNPAVPGYRLVSARSFDTESGEVEVEATLANQVIEVVRAAYQYTTTHERPYDVETFRDALLAQFYGRISALNLGATVDTGYVALPEYMSWESTQHPGTTVKIWLAEAAFADQYDEFEIVVIPAIADLDQFFLGAGEVKTVLEERTIDKMFDLIQDAKQGKPETYIRTLTYNYISPVNAALTIPTYWNVLIYGIQGDNVDSIKDAITNYVLANSTHTLDQWESLIPDLFKRTEFIVLPRWDKYAIPDLAIQYGVYSALVDPIESVEYAKAQVSFYTPAHIERNVTIVPYPYKSVSLCVVNGMKNALGKEYFPALFTDYLPIASTSLDFNRMTNFTRQWSLLMSDMLILAEKMDRFTSVPKNMRKLIRDNKLYLTAVYQNVNYLVSAKMNTTGG